MGKWTAEQLLLYENIYICAHKALCVQMEVLADTLMLYECEANHIKPAETWMSGIHLL